MLIGVVSEAKSGSAAHGGGRLQRMHPDGRPAGPPEHVPDLAAAIREREEAGPEPVPTLELGTTPINTP